MFVQMILSLSLHLASGESSSDFMRVVLYGLGIGVVGAMFTAVLNSWIRGQSLSLRKALSVDQIDKVTEWTTNDGDREYRQVYEAGGDRTLGQLAAHDWEDYHKMMEKQLGLFDLSNNVFDEMKPEKDPSLVDHRQAQLLVGGNQIPQCFDGADFRQFPQRRLGPVGRRKIGH